MALLLDKGLHEQRAVAVAAPELVRQTAQDGRTACGRNRFARAYAVDLPPVQPRSRSRRSTSRLFSRGSAASMSATASRYAATTEGRSGPAHRGLVPGSGGAGPAGSRPMRRIVRTDTPVSAAIRSCGTAAASSNLTSRRFSSPNTFSSRSGESDRGLPVREDTRERHESGRTEPARISGTDIAAEVEYMGHSTKKSEAKGDCQAIGVDWERGIFLGGTGTRPDVTVAVWLRVWTRRSLCQGGVDMANGIGYSLRTKGEEFLVWQTALDGGTERCGFILQ